MIRPILDELLIEDDIETETAPRTSPPAKSGILHGAKSPGAEFAQRMLWTACPLELRRDLRQKRSLILIIETPADWLDLVQEAARDLVRSADFVTQENKPSSKSISLQNVGLRNAIATRRSLVVTMAQGLSDISPAVLKAADYHLRVEAPSLTIIAAVIRATFGLRRTPKLSVEIPLITDANLIISAIRPNETARRSIQRLRALGKLSTPTDEVPEGQTLHDLHGYGEARRWGLDLARDLDAYRTGRIAWSTISSAAILHGAPGVGKTYFASALARTCKVPLVSTSFGRLFSTTAGYLDSIIKGLDGAFAEARAKAPCILFIDELDALPDRKHLHARGRDWWTPICNHFLKLLDDARDKIIVVGATNMIDRIDEAVLRAGRLDQHFEIGLPTYADIIEMFRFHLNGELSDIGLDNLARLAQGSTGARIEVLVKAARAAARRELRPLNLDDLRQATLPPSKDECELRRICIHEAGHALVAVLLGRGIEYVSTLADGERGGTVKLNAHSRVATRRQLESQAVINLAGRNAEIILLGEASSGAHLDLAVATQLLIALHGSFGLGESLFHRAPATDIVALSSDPELRRIVEADLQRFDAQCAKLLSEHNQQLVAIADALVTRRVLSGQELTALMAKP